MLNFDVDVDANVEVKREQRITVVDCINLFSFPKICLSKNQQIYMKHT